MRESVKRLVVFGHLTSMNGEKQESIGPIVS